MNWPGHNKIMGQIRGVLVFLVGDTFGPRQVSPLLDEILTMCLRVTVVLETSQNKYIYGIDCRVLAHPMNIAGMTKVTMNHGRIRQVML